MFGAVAAAVGQAPTAPVPALRKLILADSEAKVISLPQNQEGESQVVVVELPLLAKQELNLAVAPFFGKPISLEMVNALGNAIKQYGIKHDRILNLVVPSQDISGGVLRMAVIFGTYRDITFRGNRWFSAKMLADKLGIKEGDEISISRLDEAVNWANSNPFRRIQVLLNPIEKAPGKTDLIVGVEERMPLRLAISFDDTGAEVIGKNHYTTMLQFGNALGLDHQATYQFITTDHSKIYQAHAIDYRIPLRWRHYLQIAGSISRARPTFGGGLFAQDAKNIGATLRYTVPLSTGDNAVEWYGAMDFKQSNNNLEYGGLQIISNKTDVYHLGTGFSAVKRDKTGAWMLGGNLMFSPGALSPRNTTEVLQSARPGAASGYLYANVSLQRLFTLGKGWEIVTRAHAQVSTANLLGSEQITIGGSSSVRGYEDRIFAGDQGFVFNNEVMLPAWKTKLPFKNKNRPPLETRLLAFYDVADVSYKHLQPSDIHLSPLASVGLGLRMTLAPNFGMSFDYGWQVTSITRPSEARNRGHLKATLAF